MREPLKDFIFSSNNDCPWIFLILIFFRMKRIVVLISGNGSNLQAVIEAVASGNIKAKIELVVSNRATAYGLERAKKHGIPTFTKLLKTYKESGRTRIEYDVDLATDIKSLLGAEPDLQILAGFMHILSAQYVNSFPPGSIINLHPALPGCFEGANAIPRSLSAFKNGEITNTGVMVHCVIPEVDMGAPIVVREIEIFQNDTLADLENRIHLVEHEIIVEGIIIALGRME